MDIEVASRNLTFVKIICGFIVLPVAVSTFLLTVKYSLKEKTWALYRILTLLAILLYIELSHVNILGYNKLSEPILE